MTNLSSFNTISSCSGFFETSLPIGSSSKNTKTILEKIELDQAFDSVVDGTMISRSKPDPEVFLKAAENLHIAPENCLVVEDAAAGVQAAIDGGMKVLGVGTASADEWATYRLRDLTNVNVSELLQ